MILENLTLTDFKVFRGRHSFDLSPRKKSKHHLPIILFGGLNGSGKSTIVAAIKLALYGKHSLGFGTSKKDYDAYLKSSIHKSRSSLSQPTSSSVELTLTFSHMGVLSQYKARRIWKSLGNSVSESLQIYHNNKLVSDLNYEQCQSFLNELVPIGISNLFFFDGEKIQELADDTSGTILVDSVKNSHGLDIIERLNSDLLVLLRNQNNRSSPAEVKDEIQQLEKLLASQEEECEKEKIAYEQSRIEYFHLNSDLDRRNSEINLKGGAWAIHRENEIQNCAALVTEKNIVQEKIQNLLSGIYPISIAEKNVQTVLDQLRNESKYKQMILVRTNLTKHINDLKKIFESSLLGTTRHTVVTALDSKLKSIVEHSTICPLIHDISDSHLARVEALFHEPLNLQRKQLNTLVRQLKDLNLKIESSKKNIARAPDTETLINDFKELNKKRDALSKLQVEMMTHKENARRSLKNAIETTRKLQRLSQEFVQISDVSRVAVQAQQARITLKEFIVKLAETKVRDIESQFSRMFVQLTNKEDSKLNVNINPRTFQLNMIDEDGQLFNKNDLSAGEKQIYAISVLAALAYSSRRKLPVIIDSPLGRLDSTHRRAMINKYLPNASHQVLILSTDTEIDKPLYSEIYQHTSHAFKLIYDVESNSSKAEEGYFWNQQ